MSQIYEATVGQLEDVTKFLVENWAELSNRPLARSEEKELKYWKEVYKQKRIFYYRGDHELIISLLVLSPKNSVVTIELWSVKPQYRNQGIGSRMLQFAEKAAMMCSADEINILFSREDEVTQFYHKFHSLGYIFQCPINQKGNVLLEKRLKYNKNKYALIPFS